jgi:hypothetical protein
MSKIPQGEWDAIAARYAQGESITRIALSYGCTPPAIHYILKRNKQRVAHKLGSPPNKGRTPAPAVFQPPPTPPVPEATRPPTRPEVMPASTARKTGRASAFTAGLDSELHGRAEAAIAAFRSSFDAALSEGTPMVRQRLRQAASDLMRVAARTTIVLDRLNANVERTARAEDQFASRHVR